MKNWIITLSLFLNSFLFVQAEKLDSIGTLKVGNISFVLHKVASKETAFAISKRYQVPLDVVLKANSIASGAIKEGDTLRIPFKDNLDKWLNLVGEVKTQNNEQKNEAAFHIVKKGETLYGITKRYPELNLKQIQAWNKKVASNLKVGDTLYLTDPSNVKKPKTETSAKAIKPKATKTPDVEVKSPPTPASLKLEQNNIVALMDKSGKLSSQRNHVLHKTLPSGTLVKIENPENNRVAYAKVIGKLVDEAVTDDVIATQNLFILLGIKTDKAKINLKTLD